MSHSSTMRGRHRRWDTGARSVVRSLGWGAVVLLLTSGGRAAEGPLQGDPFRGRELLSKKLCTQCHSVWGHGGQVAPDISTAVAGKNWLELVGDFWNHTPRMIDAMAGRGHAWPTLDRDEMADLLSYLYYLRLFDEPGNAQRGSMAYLRLQCGTCHGLGSSAGRGGGPLDRFSAYPSPLMLAQAMWNAGPRMQRDQIRRGTAIPTFSGNEMADIQAYIRAEGIRESREVELQPLPSPSRGADVFETKRCVVCHPSSRAGEGPDLTVSGLHLTASEISGILWNHSYAMTDRMKARGIPFPRFKGSEMADVISYLHHLGFFAENGNADRGASLFDQRGCAGCHAGTEPEAIDLTAGRTAMDPIGLSAAMWNHAPAMHEIMDEQAVAWPTFDPGDMEHLAAYLRRLARPKGTD